MYKILIFPHLKLISTIIIVRYVLTSKILLSYEVTGLFYIYKFERKIKIELYKL